MSKADFKRRLLAAKGIKVPTVQLTGLDGNAFSILGRVRKAMRRAGYPQSAIDEYLREAKSGDYDNLLAVTMRWVDAE